MMNEMQSALLKAKLVTEKQVGKVIHQQNEKEKQQRILDKEERKVKRDEHIYNEEKMIDQQTYNITGRLDLGHATKTVIQGIKAKVGRAVVDYKKLKLKGAGNGDNKRIEKS